MKLTRPKDAVAAPLEKAIAEVRDAAELSARLAELLADDGGLGARAAEAVSRRKGVVAKCVAAMREAL